MIKAAIMAGGMSSRMRASATPKHKALVEVLGVNLLDRNLQQLRALEFKDVVVAVSFRETELIEYVERTAVSWQTMPGARLQCVIEEQPRGTIGVLWQVLKEAEDVVVVNVDNLSAINLQEMLQHHQRTKSAMTVATHIESFRIPFGEVQVADGKIERCLEKSKQPVQISSGTYVLNRVCRDFLTHDEPVGAPNLINQLVDAGQLVAAFSHSDAWIDINDNAAVSVAEKMLTENKNVFGPTA